MIAGPLWLPFLIAAIENYIDFTINEPSPWLGLLILVLGLAAAILPELAEIRARYESDSEEQNKRRQHDSNYATKLRSMLPEEEFEYILHILGGDHTMRRTHREMLSLTELELSSNESGFIDPDMQPYATRLQSAISNLLIFSALNFFTPDNLPIGDQYWMFPAGNWDRGAPTPEQERVYSQLTKGLNELLDELNASRTAFLMACRNRLL